MQEIVTGQDIIISALAPRTATNSNANIKKLTVTSTRHTKSDGEGLSMFCNDIIKAVKAVKSKPHLYFFGGSGVLKYYNEQSKPAFYYFPMNLIKGLVNISIAHERNLKNLRNSGIQFTLCCAPRMHGTEKVWKPAKPAKIIISKDVQCSLPFPLGPLPAASYETVAYALTNEIRNPKHINCRMGIAERDSKWPIKLSVIVLLVGTFISYIPTIYSAGIVKFSTIAMPIVYILSVLGKVKKFLSKDGHNAFHSENAFLPTFFFWPAIASEIAAIYLILFTDSIFGPLLSSIYMGGATFVIKESKRRALKPPPPMAPYFINVFFTFVLMVKNFGYQNGALYMLLSGIFGYLNGMVLSKINGNPYKNKKK